jgi:lysophospholipase L1-like esterase
MNITQRLHIILLKVFIFLSLICLWPVSGCRPSSNQINSNPILATVKQNVLAKNKPILAVEPLSEPDPLPDPTPTLPIQEFTPSDRIWGHLALPAEAVGKLYRALTSDLKPFKVVVYGDSHTQGGFLGEEIAKRLNDHYKGEKSPTRSSPGFVTVAHPVRSDAEVKSEGAWIRQNWLYSKDHGPFGPLGISFVTQDKNAKMNLDIDEHNGAEVTVYFDRNGQELPFCVSVPSRAGSKRCHDSGILADDESPLGRLTLTLQANENLVLHLVKGKTISAQLLRKRERSLKAIKRKRARLRKRYPRMKRSKRLAKIKAPSYAQQPHLIFPNQPHLRIFGFQVDTDSKVQVHSMGVRGATVWSPVTQSDATLDDWLKRQNPQVIALWYGTNTAARESGRLAIYEKRFRALVTKLKASAPTAACLVILPPDFGRRDPQCFLTKRQRKLLKRKYKHPKFLEELSATRRARVCDPDLLINHRKRGRHRFPVPEVKTDKQWALYKEQCTYRAPKYLVSLAEIQRKVGLEEGCAVYDTLSDMGGVGAMQKWACMEPDRLAQFDLVHLSSLGYSVIGKRLAEGLLSILELAPISPPNIQFETIGELISSP